MQGAVVEFREKFIKPSKLDEAASIHWLWCVLIKTYFPTQSLARVYSVSAHIRISDAMMWLICFAVRRYMLLSFIELKVIQAEALLS